MNNIEILEEFIDKVDIYFNDDIGDCAITSKIAGIVENLIQENKELKEKVNVLNQEKEYLNIIIDSDNNNYIPKSKVKEKIEETNNENLTYNEDDYWFEQEVKGYAIDKLQELLEGE